MKTQTNEEIKIQVLETGIITEKQILLLKKRGVNDSWIWDNTPQLTNEQNTKGIDFLKNFLYTPKGKERTSHPFGLREIDAINTFDCFEFVGFYDAARMGQSAFYLPIYNCLGSDGNFQYYCNGGKINIIG